MYKYLIIFILSFSSLSGMYQGRLSPLSEYSVFDSLDEQESPEQAFKDVAEEDLGILFACGALDRERWRARRGSLDSSIVRPRPAHIISAATLRSAPARTEGGEGEQVIADEELAEMKAVLKTWGVAQTDEELIKACKRCKEFYLKTKKSMPEKK